MSYNIKLIQSPNSQQQYGILLDHQIGRGNFGKVYKAINMNNKQQKLAVKIIPLKDNNKPSQIEREFDIVKKLPSHPNLVKFKQFKYFSENNFYLLMDYCRWNLYQQITKSTMKRLSESKVVDLFYQLINGYKVLYDAKILHQDIKPQNVLIKEGIYKLADFGLSIFYQNHMFESKREGSIGYIAPQKITTKNYKGNPKSDIYSIGIVIYEAMTGKHPYLDLDNWKTQKKISQIVDQLQSTKFKVPLSFNQIFQKLLQMTDKNQNKRISFDKLYQFINTSPIFNTSKKLTKKQSSFEQSKHLSNSNLIVKQVSQILMIPFDALDDQQQKLIQNFKQTKSLKQKNYNQQSIQNLTNYLLERRMIVYFLDRLARRLIVRKMKSIQSALECKSIIHLILFSKSITTQVLSQIQAPKKFSFMEWKLFSNHQNKKLIDLVLKDNKYLQGIIYDTFVQDNYLSKADLKSINCLYRAGGKDKQTLSLKNILLQTVKQMSSLINSSDTSIMVTLLLLLKSSQLIEMKQLSHNQILKVQNFNRMLQQKTTEQLRDITLQQCQKRSIAVGFDFSDEAELI